MKLIFKTDALLNKSPLTLCILETPKRVLLQTVKTLFVMVKKIFRTKKYNILKNYSLKPLEIYNGPSQG